MTIEQLKPLIAAGYDISIKKTTEIYTSGSTFTFEDLERSDWELVMPRVVVEEDITKTIDGKLKEIGNLTSSIIKWQTALHHLIEIEK